MPESRRPSSSGVTSVERALELDRVNSSRLGPPSADSQLYETAAAQEGHFTRIAGRLALLRVADAVYVLDPEGERIGFAGACGGPLQDPCCDFLAWRQDHAPWIDQAPDN